MAALECWEDTRPGLGLQEVLFSNRMILFLLSFYMQIQGGYGEVISVPLKVDVLKAFSFLPLLLWSVSQAGFEEGWNP